MTKKSSETSRYYHGTFKEWGRSAATVAVTYLYSLEEHNKLILNRLKTLRPETIKTQLDFTMQVALYMHLPEARQYLDYDSFPPRAKANILLLKPDLFDTLYDPETASDALNRAIFLEYAHQIGVSKFLSKVSDKVLATLLHKHTEFLTTALMKDRIKRTSKIANRISKVFDCSKVRNQSHLRHFIVRYPWVMKRQTLDQMKASSIKAETWARLLAEIKTADRAYFPAGIAEWVKKAVFTKKLKGRKFKPFKDFETGLPLDPDATSVVKSQHENDLPQIDTIVEEA